MGVLIATRVLLLLDPLSREFGNTCMYTNPLLFLIKCFPNFFEYGPPCKCLKYCLTFLRTLVFHGIHLPHGTIAIAFVYLDFNKY